MSKRKSKSKKKGGHGFGPASLNGQKKRKSKRKKKSRFLSFLSNAWPALAFVTFWAGIAIWEFDTWENRINSSDYTYDQALQELTLVESERIYGSNDSFECIWDDGEMLLKLGFDAHGILISYEKIFYKPRWIG